MKPTRFTEEQIIGILREHEAEAKTVDVFPKHGISSATFYKWKAKYGGLEVSDAKRLKRLDSAMLKDVAAKKMVTPAARREAIAHLRTCFAVSERRACTALGVERTSVRYRSSRPDDAPVRARLRALAAVRRRFGYRRLHISMRREGLVMNHKKPRRFYREERLQVRRRSGRKRALGTLAPGTNSNWQLTWMAEATEKISPALQKSGSAMPIGPEASTPMARAPGGDQEEGPDRAGSTAERRQALPQSYRRPAMPLWHRWRM